jgi:oxygen-independent coproporphyrinogen-3 oxidase
MYGLPEQTAAMARADIEQGGRSGTPHLSAYQLTIEPNTVFWNKPPTLPEHDAAADMQLTAESLLAQAGYEHYETSAFAKPGQRCRHNLNYWEFGDYLGIGAGAHGKVSLPDRITRHERIKQPAEYLKAATTMTERTLSAAELPFEFMLNALRLIEGFPAPLFSQRTGLPLASIDKQMDNAEKAGLLQRDWQRIRPTERGQRFLNELLALFLPDEKPGRAPGVPIAVRAIRTS